MTIGTCSRRQTSVSWASRAFAWLTMRLTAKGAPRRSGCAASNRATPSRMRAIQSASIASGRAFSDGNAPTMPAVHWAMTRSGPDTRNIGAPTTGIVSPEREAGIGMKAGSLRWIVPDGWTGDDSASAAAGQQPCRSTAGG